MRSLVSITMIFLIVSSESGAVEYPIHVNPDGESTDVYCGLYCVYQAGQMVGKPIPLDELIQPKRLTGQFGSSVQDLISTLDEFHIGNDYVPSASYHDHILLDIPAIVLVKSAPDALSGNHWVMILKSQLDTVKVYDPSVGVHWVPVAEFQTLLTGPTILLQRHEDTITLWHSVKALIFILFSVGVYGVLRLVLMIHSQAVVALFLTTLLIVLVWQMTDPASFLYNRNVTDQTVSINEVRDIPLISPQEILDYPDRYTLIDVRTQAQYQSHTIPGSLNLPVNSSYHRNRRRCADLPSDRPLVLYCQSVQCGWAEQMARSALFSRFHSIFVLDDGIHGYSLAKKQTSK